MLIGSVKHMPWWFPGAGLKKEAQKWKPSVHAFAEVPFEATKKAMVCIAYSLYLSDIYSYTSPGKRKCTCFCRGIAN
jgi:hypothetical protein